MENQIIPPDIQEDADSLFIQSDRIEEMNDHLPQRALYIQGRLKERDLYKRASLPANIPEDIFFIAADTDYRIPERIAFMNGMMKERANNNEEIEKLKTIIYTLNTRLTGKYEMPGEELNKDIEKYLRIFANNKK